MHECTKEEMEIIQEFQARMKSAKQDLRAGRALMKRLYKINETAGNFGDAVGINKVKAQVTVTLGALDVLDAAAGEVAVGCYSEPGPIVLGGGR